MRNNYTSCCNRIDFVVIPTYIECPCIQKTYSINEIVEDFDVFHRIFFSKCAQYHVKNVQIRRFFWFVFSCIQSEYRKARTRKNSVFGHFSRSVNLALSADQQRLLRIVVQNNNRLYGANRKGTFINLLVSAKVSCVISYSSIWKTQLDQEQELPYMQKRNPKHMFHFDKMRIEL